MSVWWTSRHRGVDERDPRNAGVIAHFRPPEVTADYVRAQFAPLFEDDTAEELEARVAAFMADLDAKPRPPPAVLSRAVDTVKDPYYSLGTHPALVEQLWRLDDGLPKRCRWMVWGRPALVHPDTGIIFAVALGSIGIVARLPEGFAESPGTRRPLGKGRVYDIGGAGPDWAFLPSAHAEAACEAAYELAAAAS